jgi:hypothetical protein
VLCGGRGFIDEMATLEGREDGTAGSKVIDKREIPALEPPSEDRADLIVQESKAGERPATYSRDLFLLVTAHATVLCFDIL